MSATLYQTELTSLASESKRRFPEIKSAAEKSLQELKSINVTSEQQLAADLRRKPDFIDPFLKACLSSNAKLAISGVNALQRLVISQGLPRSRLDETLQALNACAELGLDVQLKVLQALPSLVQNYSEELTDKLLGSALQVCAALQGARVSTISAVAAATLQQIVASVFARVTEEDQRAHDIATVASVPGEEGNIDVRPAAYDAYRVFRDLALAAEGRSTQLVQFTTLSKEECLELIASCIEAKPQLFDKHEELMRIVRTSVVSLAAACLTEQQSFTITVRCIRILRLLILWFFVELQAELEPAISLFTHTMEAEISAVWKKALIMEILRDVFQENSLAIKIYLAYDGAEAGHAVIQDILAAFVRLSAEKPAVIGLGQQSTCPVNPISSRDISAEQLVADPVSGVANMLSSFGMNEHNIQGISSSWSIPKSPCYEQLDKSQPPSLPETYVYSLVLDCLNGLSDTLAKVVLPMTVQHKHTPASNEAAIRGATDLVESCWPAVLATCSTFMNAALDDGYYRGLIKAYQRFAQVAGLLRLDTPRDALMTTLGKAAVPPQVLSAATTEAVRTPVIESPRVFSNPKNLLSIESFVSQASSMSDKDRRSSMEQVKPVLTVRNLLCLRALLNLAIALGPSLDSAFVVVVQVLKHADIVLSSSMSQLGRTNTNTSQQSDHPSAVQTFSTEVAAVEAAASRLLESTADYPDEAFTVVLHAFGDILHQQDNVMNVAIAEEPEVESSPRPPRQRSFSGMPSLNVVDTRSKALQFALPKLATLAALNVARFISVDSETSGWDYITDEVVAIAASSTNPGSARKSAADLLCRLAAECILEATVQDDRGVTQIKSLRLLLRVISCIYEEDGHLTNSDLEVQSHIINSVRTILEQSGDTIEAGWDIVVAILSTTFESDNGIAVLPKGSTIDIDWAHLSHDFVSLRLGRETFNTIQLLITDFFGQLPTSSTAAVIELLFRFMVQSEDLNLSLTAITMVWNVADHLFNLKSKSDASLPTIKAEADASQFDAQLATLSQTSTSAQWILLLIRLRQIVQRGSREPAKAAFQTLCSIAKNTGSQLPLDLWAIVLRHILIGVLADEATCANWRDRELTAILLEGAAETISQQIELVSGLPRLVETWASFTDILVSIVERHDYSIYTAVYKALATILEQINEPSSAWQEAIGRTFAMWSSHNPSDLELVSEVNQSAFRAYTRTGSQLLRLTSGRTTLHGAESLATNLEACVRKSGTTIYSADSQVLSACQSEVLAVLKAIPKDIDGVIPKLIDVAAGFTVLHKIEGTQTSQSNKHSYVALGAEAMMWLENLLRTHLDETTMAQSGAIQRALMALADVVEEKYRFQIEYKGRWLWRIATDVAVMLAEPVLRAFDDAPEQPRLAVLQQYLRLAHNISHANGLQSFQNEDRTFDDEELDVLASQRLADALGPRLSQSWVPDAVLREYVLGLFEASIMHPMGWSSLDDLLIAPLEYVGSVRRATVKRLVPSRREHMSYECLSQLAAISSAIESASEDRVRLARIAAPLLIVRLAFPIKAYIADQPLRGRMPQPLSELEELLYCFKQVKEIRISDNALPASTASADGHHAHLRYLRPLLIKAMKVAGDKRCGSREVFDPLQQTLESLIIDVSFRSKH